MYKLYDASKIFYCDNHTELQYVLHNCSTPVPDAIFVFAAYGLSGTGTSKDHVGAGLGRFEFVPGVEKEGSLVYRQAHSQEIETALGEIFLYRWDMSCH